MNLLLHPGYPKTGTTTLQLHLFGVSDVFNCLARPEMNKRWGEFAFFPRSVIAEDTHMFRESFSELVEYVESKVAQAPSGIAVFSEEGLLNFNSGPEDFRLRGQNNIGLTAIRMKEILDTASNVNEVKVLLTIRNQFDLLLSFYTHFYYQFYRGSIFENSFSSFIDYNLGNSDVGILSTLYYDKVVRLYQDIYGEKNVLVLPLEMLEIDKEMFIERLQCFCGLPDHAFESLVKHSPKRNRSQKTETGVYVAKTTLYDALVLRQIRMLNAFSLFLEKSPSAFKKISKKITLQTKITYDATQESVINGLYADANRELQVMTGLNLKTYGYSL